MLVNLGTPDSPTRADVKKYLDEFLSDIRVVDSPRWFWLPLLRGIILPVRSGRSAKLYESIWTEHGSPLLYHTKGLAEKLDKEIELPVKWAMRYGSQSISSQLEAFKNKGITSVKVIPLFAQYSHTTVGSVNDKVKEYCEAHNDMSCQVLQGFCLNDTAVELWADQLRPAIENDPDVHLVMTFHGLPERYITQGDPYFDECLASAHAVVEKLPIKSWTPCFQSQFGPEQWLEPSTDDALVELAEQKKSVVMTAIGFSSDCLETLEELDEDYCELYEVSGGPAITRVPCLNQSDEAVTLMKALI